MIYFDNAATTLVDKEVLNTYNKISLQLYANPSSPHSFAKESDAYLSKARNAILSLLHLNDTYEVIFTSNATEANNLGTIGYCLANPYNGKEIITTKVEHASILEPLKFLETNHGYKIHYVNVDEFGEVDLIHLQSLINENTVLVAIMSVNNELGTINDLAKIKEIIKNKNEKTAFYSDSTQAIGKADLKYNSCDFLCLSAHKIHGLKGAGVLIKKRKLRIVPFVHGGGQEGGLRSGTVDVAGAYCLAKALQIAVISLKNNQNYIQKLFDHLYTKLKENEELFLINSPKNASPYILNFTLKTAKASVVTEALSMKGIMVSSVSACSSKKEPLSYVLLAIGRNEEEAKNSIRVSFSKENTIEEIDILIDSLKEICAEIRK